MEDQTMPAGNVHDEALSQLVKDLGIDTLSQDKQNEIIIKMTEVLLKRIFLETMEKLGDNGREEYMNLMNQGEVAPEQVEAFFKERIANYDEVVGQVIEEFRGEMMQSQN